MQKETKALNRERNETAKKSIGDLPQKTRE
jgi:hypothetical protein